MASYAVSFVILGTLWVGHHYQFHFIHRSDRALLWIHPLLALRPFLPFATALVGFFPGERLAVLTYGGTLMAAPLCLLAPWEYASGRRRLLGSAASGAGVRAIRARGSGDGVLRYRAPLGILQPNSCALPVRDMPILYLVPTRIDQHVRRS